MFQQSTRVPMVDTYGAPVFIQGWVSLQYDRAQLSNGQIERHGFGAFWFAPSVVATIEHDRNMIIARTEDGLKVGQNEHGIWASVPVFQDAISEAALGCVSAGVFGWSCEFLRLDAEENRYGELINREARLHEITLTTNPAYEKGAAWSSGVNDRYLPAHVVEQRNLFRASMQRQFKGATYGAPVPAGCQW